MQIGRSVFELLLDMLTTGDRRTDGRMDGIACRHIISRCTNPVIWSYSGKEDGIVETTRIYPSSAVKQIIRIFF